MLLLLTLDTHVWDVVLFTCLFNDHDFFQFRRRRLLPERQRGHCIGFHRPATTGGQSGNCPPPKFSRTYVFVRWSNKLHHFAPTENISCSRPWAIM